METIDPQLIESLACPADGSPLRLVGHQLESAAGRSYPIINGVPVLLPPDASKDTLDCIRAGRQAASGETSDPWFLEALGCSEDERKSILRLAEHTGNTVDPVVSHLVAATCGNLYRHLIGRLSEYPIPEFRMKNGNGRVLLDIGCNWGRWCVAAAREGFRPLGVDPQLGALMAAKRVAKQLGVSAWFVCGDARQLPLRADSADAAFSYSVLQHLSHEDVKQSLLGVARALRPGGTAMIQMPTNVGLKGFLHRAKNGFRSPRNFDVRYWSRRQLRDTFSEIVGPTELSVDCFFGIGLQASDARLMPPSFKAAIAASETLRALSGVLTPVGWLADSVYVCSESRKTVAE